MCGIVVVTDHVRLLMAALCADEDLRIQIELLIVSLNQLEP
jgi:hypothetical protein